VYISSVISEITLVGVADPGVATQERVLLRPTEETTIAGLGLAVGVPASGGGAYTVFDNVYWFPSEMVEPPSWIIL
jgi:hypothetical protein